MSEYTPTTQQVRRYWQYGANAWSAASADDRDPVGQRFGAQFDRWLAAHDAEVKAEAWDEGYSAGNNTGLCGGCEDCELWSNPYRKVVE